MTGDAAAGPGRSDAEDRDDPDGRTPTLGERLDRLARRLAARPLPTFAWAALVEPVMRRAAGQPVTGRFDRTEADPGALALPRRGAARAARPYPGPGAPPVAPVAAGPAGRAVWAGGPSAPGAEPASLPAGVRARLRDLAGPGADALRVRTDDAADAVARAHRADAVTIGAEVHFRRGRFRPHEDRGFALLAHEARHVLALLQPGVAWRRATGAGRAAEEAEARAAERHALAGPAERPTPQWPHRPGRAPVPADPPPAPVARPPGPARDATAAAHPMPAEVNRQAPAPPSERLDVAALRRDLMEELVRRLRSEFERGG